MKNYGFNKNRVFNIVDNSIIHLDRLNNIIYYSNFLGGWIFNNVTPTQNENGCLYLTTTTIGQPSSAVYNLPRPVDKLVFGIRLYGKTTKRGDSLNVYFKVFNNTIISKSMYMASDDYLEEAFISGTVFIWREGSDMKIYYLGQLTWHEEEDADPGHYDNYSHSVPSGIKTTTLSNPAIEIGISGTFQSGSDGQFYAEITPIFGFSD